MHKFENRYYRTMVGKLVYQEILKIEKYIDYANNMKMIDILEDSGQFSKNDMFHKKVSNKKHYESLLDIATDHCATHHFRFFCFNSNQAIYNVKSQVLQG